MDVLEGFALVAGVLTLSALAAGLVERAPLSFPMLFLGLGFLLGGGGLEVLPVGPHDQVLGVVSTFTLALVLFLDAVNLEMDEIRRGWLVPALALGPGTVLTILAIAGAAIVLVDVSVVPALIIGAVLSSTDPVVLRDVVRDRRIPHAVRRALSVEAGTNDVVVLPVILVLIAIGTRAAATATDWFVFSVQLFVLGPAAGFAVGAGGSWLMSRADARFAIRPEYQSLYGVGLVLAAFVAGDGVGGDGFLAAFAAGAAVTLLNHRLCDCFLEFGQVVTEMAMLVAFVLFGSALSELVGLAPSLGSLTLAALAIFVARPLAMGLLLRLRRAALSPGARLFIAWFGPRGLNSLLFGLLVLEAGMPNGERLLAIVGVVVAVSVVAHGASATPLSSWYARRVAAETLAEERVSTAAGLFAATDDDVPRIAPAQLAARLGGPSPPVVLDVRSRSSHAKDPVRVPGAARVLPDEIAGWATGQLPHHAIVLYCN